METIARLWTATCEEAAEALSDQLDGELRGIRRWRVTRHLERCERCRPLLESLARAVDQLRALGGRHLPPNPATANAIVERIRLESAAP